MNKMRVVYKGWGERWPLGTLAAAGTSLMFEYSPEALTRKLELSPLRMPLRAQATSRGEPFFEGLPGFIADALPDGWGRMLMDRAFRKAGREPAMVSVLERLAFIGDRAMGALTFEPTMENVLNAHDLALLDLARRIDGLTAGASAAVLNELVLIGGSPQGARPKALVHYDGASRRMIGGGAHDAKGEPWIIKFPARGEHAETCAIEELYACLARACGIEMTESAYFPLNRRLAAFGARRFDRVRGMRVPVLTLAGALHNDYRVPGVDAIDFLRLTKLMTGDMREVQSAFERCVFNLVFNNRDDHAKNFSYRLGHDGRWRISPAYDLTFNPGPRGHHQMAYAGETLAPRLANVLGVAEKGEISDAKARQIVKRMASIAGQIAKRADALPIRKATLRLIVDAVGANCARLKR
ncbi:MAG: type II toxin-antitoxin system HipA family toxin [Betaproteobacteria bacterium]|nr:type II toxin-antitoxin system HipA family toxin [Betaproteobacteria bacterium]